MPFCPSGARIAGRYEVTGQPLMGGIPCRAQVGIVSCHDRQEDCAVAFKIRSGRFHSRKA
jgi:hypothetical protein